MSAFESFFLMKPDDVKRYVMEVVHHFPSDASLRCTEIGDGNINYVFRVEDVASGRSVVVKQSDKLLRSSGRPLDIGRSKIEARALMLEATLAPDYLPQVYHYDETMAAICMEDISAYQNLRKELLEGPVYSHLSDNLSSFLAQTLLPTTDLVMDRQEKKAAVKFFVNPELCDITEDLVLTEPYDDYKGRNVITPGNEAFVERFLYRNDELKAEIALLRDRFMNEAQALIHGDLHTGSIFVNASGMKVIDPEFAFYGPMGYDIGNVLGNLFFSWAHKAYVRPDEPTAALERLIAETYDMTRDKLKQTYDDTVTFPLYRVPAFQENYLAGVIADSLGYAGTEIIRRTVGDSKVMEVASVDDLDEKISMERALIKLGMSLIRQRAAIRRGDQLVDAFRLVMA